MAAAFGVAFASPLNKLGVVVRSLGLLLAGLVLGLSACSRYNEWSRSGAISGTIETDETRVASRYGGRVIQILSREGDGLYPGQVLILLEAAELQSRQAQLQALLEELRSGPRKEEIQAARSEWEAAAAEHDFATAEAARLRELFREGTVAEAELERAVSRANYLEKQVAAARSRHELLLAGTRPERIAQVQAQLAELQTQLRETEILSPTNSVLEVLHVKTGDVLSPNQPAATLLLTNHLWVRVYLPQPWLGHIQVGERVEVQADSFPDKKFVGEIEQISRAAEFTPRNVQTVEERAKQVFGVKIRLPTDTGELRAGMAVNIHFPQAHPGIHPSRVASSP